MLKKTLFITFLGLSFIIVSLVVRTLENYYHPTLPFTDGLYTNSIEGRIKAMKRYKDIITVELLPSDSSYYFSPLIITKPTRLDFKKIVQPGDSLWKYPNSNVIYTLDREGMTCRWTFIIHDNSDRLYPDSSAVDSSLYFIDQ